jgi:hypothetical protein
LDYAKQTFANKQFKPPGFKKKIDEINSARKRSPAHLHCR